MVYVNVFASAACNGFFKEISNAEVIGNIIDNNDILVEFYENYLKILSLGRHLNKKQYRTIVIRLL